MDQDHMPHCGCDGNHFGRRDFLRIGSLTFLGMNLGQFLQVKHLLAAQEAVNKAKAQACILVWLDGGPSQMDTWDPKANSAFKPIATNAPGIQISEAFPKLAQHFDKLSVIRSMHSITNNHMDGHSYALTGHEVSPVMDFPSIGSIINKELGPRNAIPPYVMVSGLNTLQEDYSKAKFIGAKFDPMLVRGPVSNPPSKVPEEEYVLPDLSLPKSITRGRMHNRRYFGHLVDKHYRRHVEAAEFTAMDDFTEQAWNMILAPEVREAFDLDKEPESMHEAYGRYPVGQSMLLARRLVEAGSRFVTAAGYRTQAWDAHGNNDQLTRDHLAPTLDQSLSALLEDLKQRGMLDSTLVVVMGEFGRTAEFNPYNGRDHWSECWSMVLGGGGLQGGQVIGASDERGAYVADRMVSVGDVHATIYKAMGIDWHKEYMHPVGRPIKIANALDDQTATPLRELI